MSCAIEKLISLLQTIDDTNVKIAATISTPDEFVEAMRIRYDEVKLEIEERQIKDVYVDMFVTDTIFVCIPVPDNVNLIEEQRYFGIDVYDEKLDSFQTTYFKTFDEAALYLKEILSNS